jgi:hypothetical protein
MVLCVIGEVFSFGGVFNFHIPEFLRVKHLATLQAFDILSVFVPGDDTYFRMPAGVSHHDQFQLELIALFARL